VVTCYQLLQKPHRAEMVVREQLRAKGETPYMLTALADLTDSDALYEQAWALSKGRYARAKRTLAKRCFDRGEYQACVGHLDDALAVQPLVPQSWFLKGISCMRLEQVRPKRHHVCPFFCPVMPKRAHAPSIPPFAMQCVASFRSRWKPLPGACSRTRRSARRGPTSGRST